MADETTPGDEPPAEKPKYDQTFFLDLAAKGKDAWNAWRRDPANKDVRVTFAGIDFSMAPRDQINFEWFQFGTMRISRGVSGRAAEARFSKASCRASPASPERPSVTLPTSATPSSVTLPPSPMRPLA
ncbi:MAG TPA: hypothetical protein VHT48_07940, partial [Methylocella sp.]|nr:hypothetical protein [Methylocella sp.]